MSVFSFPPAGWILSGVLLITTAGCGSQGAKGDPKTIPVYGRITLDGVPLEGAAVVFLPENLSEGQGVATARTDSRGEYELAYNASHSGAQAGTYRVAVSTVQTTEEGDLVGTELLPEVYNRKTELTAKVSKESRSFDFDLRTDAGPVPRALPPQ